MSDYANRKGVLLNVKLLIKPLHVRVGTIRLKGEKKVDGAWFALTYTYRNPIGNKKQAFQGVSRLYVTLHNPVSDDVENLVDYTLRSSEESFWASLLPLSVILRSNAEMSS